MLYINVDIEGLKGLGDEITAGLQTAASQANKELAAMAHAKAVELAGQRLHSRRQMFVEALSLTEADGVPVLTLDAKAVWIDTGLPRHNMLDDLLSSPKAKRAADGSLYLVVPFHHGPGKGPADDPPGHQDLVNTLKATFKSKKIPWGKIERDDQGRPKLGRLHKFDIDHQPLKTHDGPWQGRGPVGDVRQGPNARQAAGGGPGGGGTPLLHQVNVYQKMKEGGGVSRSVMTFRIASSKHQGQDRWDHPGLEPTNIFADVETWITETAEREILPRLVDQVFSKL